MTLIQKRAILCPLSGYLLDRKGRRVKPQQLSPHMSQCKDVLRNEGAVYPLGIVDEQADVHNDDNESLHVDKSLPERCFTEKTSC